MQDKYEPLFDRAREIIHSTKKAKSNVIKHCIEELTKLQEVMDNQIVASIHEHKNRMKM